MEGFLLCFPTLKKGKKNTSVFKWLFVCCLWSVKDRQGLEIQITSSGPSQSGAGEPTFRFDSDTGVTTHVDGSTRWETMRKIQAMAEFQSSEVVHSLRGSEEGCRANSGWLKEGAVWPCWRSVGLVCFVPECKWWTWCSYQHQNQSNINKAWNKQTTGRRLHILLGSRRVSRKRLFFWSLGKGCCQRSRWVDWIEPKHTNMQSLESACKQSRCSDGPLCFLLNCVLFNTAGMFR